MIWQFLYSKYFSCIVQSQLPRMSYFVHRQAKLIYILLNLSCKKHLFSNNIRMGAVQTLASSQNNFLFVVRVFTLNKN